MTSATFWLILGVALYILEVLGASGFLMGAAHAAIAMALVTFLFDLGWMYQGIAYAIMAAITTYVYFQFFRTTCPVSEQPALHDRAGSLIGIRFDMPENLDSGDQTRIALEDSVWRVKASTKLEKGQRARVSGNDGTLLIVEPCD